MQNERRDNIRAEDRGDSDISDCSCNCKKRTGMTYQLKVEREGDGSDQFRRQHKSRDDVQPGGEEGCHVRLGL
jgi:hypothetical protein